MPNDSKRPEAVKPCATCEGSRRVQLLPARGIRLSGRKMFMDCPGCRPDFPYKLITELTLQANKLRGRISALLAVLMIETLLFASYVVSTT